MVELSPKELLRLLRRWWWLLLLTPVITGVSASLLNQWQQPQATTTYTAVATVLINPDAAGAEYQPATLRAMVGLQPVLQPVADRLALPDGVGGLKSRITAGMTEDSDLLSVAATVDDPVQAATLANAVAESFVAFLTDQAEMGVQPYRDAIQNLLDEVNTELGGIEASLAAQLAALQAGTPVPEAEIDRLSNRQAAIERQAGTYRNQLDAQNLEIAAGSVQAQVSERAVPPSDPNATDSLPVVPLAVLVGLALAAAAILVFEALDVSIRTDTDFLGILGAPLLGSIPWLRRARAPASRLFYRNKAGRAPAEAMRRLRGRLQLAGALQPAKALAVTSPATGDGKSTIAANLALALAQSGSSVILVDANLGHPLQHQIFEVPNHHGLADLLVDRARPWHDVAVEIAPGGVTLIPAGQAKLNPADLVTAARLRPLLEELGRAADYVLIDCPAILDSTEAVVIASSAESTLLVCRRGRTTTEDLVRAAGAFPVGVGRIAGAVINGLAGDAVDIGGSQPAANHGERRARPTPFDGGPPSPALPSERAAAR